LCSSTEIIFSFLWNFWIQKQQCARKAASNQSGSKQNEKRDR
jgi:hypothetical protein